MSESKIKTPEISALSNDELQQLGLPILTLVPVEGGLYISMPEPRILEYQNFKPEQKEQFKKYVVETITNFFNQLETFKIQQKPKRRETSDGLH